MKRISMFRNFLFFPKGQRVGIIVLLVLIFILIIITNIIPYFDNNKFVKSEFIIEAKKFEKNLVLRDSIAHSEYLRRYKRFYHSNYDSGIRYGSNSSKIVSLFYFDPNAIDSFQFSLLGIRPKLISTILKFRGHGGTFKTSDDFAKVYGLSRKQFEELKSYIKISTSITKDTAGVALAKRRESFCRVEINTADSVELMRIPGIGRFYARNLIRYRNALGGFENINQLLELKGMTHSNFERIKSNCIIDKSLVRKILINTASVQRLSSHPYLNFYQSKAIYELRRREGKLTCISALSKLPEITPEDLVRVEPYLSFQ